MAIEAGQLAGTVLVNTALGLNGAPKLLAGHVRVSGRSRSALANRLMVLTSTSGSICTSLSIAYLAAHPVQTIARLIVGAVLIVLALTANASHQRIALVACLAHTVGAMVLRKAFGTTAAL